MISYKKLTYKKLYNICMKKFIYILILILFVIISVIFSILNTENQKNDINIVMITDNNYVSPTRATIRSIIANKNTDTKIKIYVVGLELRKENIKKLNSESKNKTKVKVISPSKKVLSEINKLPNHTKYNIGNKADYIKFKLTTVLPRLDKVLYMDGDVIVLKDLTDLYKTDLKDNYIAAADDWQSKKTDKFNNRFFNNGIMILNLKKMRKDNIDAKLFEYKLNDKDNRFMTQDAYNDVMIDKVLFIPLIYDTFVTEYENKDILNRIKEVLGDNYNKEIYPYKTAEEYKKAIVILHYCGWGYLKPWHKYHRHKDSETSQIWYKYAPSN